MLDTHCRKYVDPIIERTSDRCIRLRLSANKVTIAAFVTGALSAVSLISGMRILSVALLWFSGFLDAVDGSIARKLNQSSPWGTLMDITFDRIVEILVILGLGYLYPYSRFSLMLLLSSIIISMTVFLTVGALTEKSGKKSFYYQAGLMERTEGFIMSTIMILFPGRLTTLSLIYFLLILFTAFQRLREAYRIMNHK